MTIHTERVSQSREPNPSLKKCVREFCNRSFSRGFKASRYLREIKNLMNDAAKEEGIEIPGTTNLSYLRHCEEMLRPFIEAVGQGDERLMAKREAICDDLKNLNMALLALYSTVRLNKEQSEVTRKTLASGVKTITNAMKMAWECLELKNEEMKELQQKSPSDYKREATRQWNEVKKDCQKVAELRSGNQIVIDNMIRQRMREGYSKEEAEATLADYHFQIPPDKEQALTDMHRDQHTLRDMIAILDRIKHTYERLVINQGLSGSRER